MTDRERVKVIEKLFKLRNSKQWGKYESLARASLKQEPNDVYLIQAIGQALEKQGHSDEALKYYEKALEVDRQENHEIGHTFFLKRLDILYHRGGRYDDCLRVCKYYTRRHASSWDAWNRLRRAAQKTGNTELSLIASEHADNIKAQSEAEKKAQEIRDRQWRTLYERSLKEQGFEPHPSSGDLDEEPHPSFEASDEEWGMWAQDTTDMERIEAKLQAAFYATEELEGMGREEIGGVTIKSSHNSIASALWDLQEKGGFVIFSVGDYYVQFTCRIDDIEIYGEAVSDEYLPDERTLDPSQITELIQRGWNAPPEPNYYRTFTARTDQDRQAISKEVIETFQVYGVSSEEPLQIEIGFD